MNRVPGIYNSFKRSKFMYLEKKIYIYICLKNVIYRSNYIVWINDFFLFFFKQIANYVVEYILFKLFDV